VNPSLTACEWSLYGATMNKLVAGQLVLTFLLTNTLMRGIELRGLAFQFSSEPGIYLTPYRLSERPPNGLEEFDSFYLERFPGQEQGIMVNRRGDVQIGGAIHTKRGDYEFKSAKLIKGKSCYERLTFTTTQANGISYEFNGRYLENADEVNGQYITLKGILIKFKGGRRAASGKIGLYQWVKL
jgi:hypothetical protein